MELLSLLFVLLVLGGLAAYYGVGHVAPQHQWKVLLATSMTFYILAGGWVALALLVATSLDIWYGGLTLKRLRHGIPDNWDEQRREFGFL